MSEAGKPHLHSLPPEERSLSPSMGHGMVSHGEHVARYVVVPWLLKDQAVRYDDDTIAVSSAAPTEPMASERPDGTEPEPGDLDYVPTQSDLVRTLLEQEFGQAAKLGRTSVSFQEVRLDVELAKADVLADQGAAERAA